MGEREVGFCVKERRGKKREFFCSLFAKLRRRTIKLNSYFTKLPLNFQFSVCRFKRSLLYQHRKRGEGEKNPARKDVETKHFSPLLLLLHFRARLFLRPTFPSGKASKHGGGRSERRRRKMCFFFLLYHYHHCTTFLLLSSKMSHARIQIRLLLKESTQ